jgi:tripartite-type tricarboxylate transporter receptor subunit TctC
MIFPKDRHGIDRAGTHWEEIMALVRRRFLCLAGMLPITSAFGGSIALAQNAAATFPERPIRLIVPYTPGGPSDVMGRLISECLSATFAQQAYVDNRPGAGSTLGGKIAASAEPDGYTLLIATAATLAIGPTLYPDSGLDPKIFVPIAMFATVPFVMVGGPKTPPGGIVEIVAYAKAHPGKLTIGVPNGAPPHMLAAWFKSLTGTDIVIVPYKGASGDLADLIAGQIDLAIETTSVVLPHLSAGTLRPLATATSERLSDTPNVPTMIESGVPGFVALSWTGLAAPPGTPQPIVEKLNAAINAKLTSADINAKLAKLGATARPGSPGQFADFVAGEVPKWTAMAKLAGIHGE